MLKLFGFSLKQFVRIVGWQLLHLFDDGLVGALRNLLLICVAMPIFLLFQLWHWVGFLCDEIFFRRYRQVKINKPIFVVGVPRSGTTFLQRTMAQDDNLTTTTLWDCVIAPSITEKKLYRLFGKPLKPVSKWLNGKGPAFLKEMESIHSLGLGEAEEDFLLLLPIFSSFILMVIFPNNKVIWELAHFDNAMSAKDKKSVMDFYQLSLQKHLYVYGEHKRYLSKNPSFTSLLSAMADRFKDSTIVGCVRPPEKTVPSQISSLKPAFKLLMFNPDQPVFKQKITEMLFFYYAHLVAMKQQHPKQILLVEMQALNQHLLHCLTDIYDCADMTLTPELVKHYRNISAETRAYKSKHSYSSQSVGMEEQSIKQQFQSVWPVDKQLLIGVDESVQGLVTA